MRRRRPQKSRRQDRYKFRDAKYSSWRDSTRRQLRQCRGEARDAKSRQPEINYNLRIHFLKFAQSLRKPNLRNHHRALREKLIAQGGRNHFSKFPRPLRRLRRMRVARGVSWVSLMRSYGGAIVLVVGGLRGSSPRECVRARKKFCRLAS